MDNTAHAFLANYQFLARYNRWFNGRFFDACEKLPRDERYKDRGAFFGSIHGGLNHVMWADRLWLRRITQQGFDFPSLTADVMELPEGAVHETILYEDWDQLRQAREAMDAAIEEWVRGMPEGFLTFNLRYANTKGVPREHPAWQALTHFFNHQTHHRGQITTLLTQAGVDVGVTDIIALI